MQTRHWDDEIVVLVLNRNEAEIVPARHSFDGQAPVSPTLCHRGGNGVMGVGLRPIASRPVTSEQAIDQDPRTASRVAAYHNAVCGRTRRRHGSLCGAPVESIIPWSKDNSL